MTPKFAIGSNVQFGDEGWWKVIRYHVVYGTQVFWQQAAPEGGLVLPQPA